MKIGLYLSVKRREVGLREALEKGFKRHGDTVDSMLRKEFSQHHNQSGCDLAVFVGVKSRKIWNKCMADSKQTLLLDKGYFDRAGSYRMSIGGYQPPYLDSMRQDDSRLRSLGVAIEQRRTGDLIIYAGSSKKYCMFHDLGDVTDYAHKICAAINEHAPKDKRVLYRPKPSWWVNDDEDVQKTVPPNTRLSPPEQNFKALLRSTQCIVTHGSNAAVEALAAGVPVVLTSEPGASAVYDLCEHDMAKLATPFWPTDAARKQRLANLAWCQFNLQEIAAGFAWECLKPHARGM